MKYYKTFLLIVIFVLSVLMVNIKAEELNGIINENGSTYYYINSEKQTGFQEINGKKYFFSRINDNAMRTGWVLIDGFYYYFSENGEMQKGLIEIDSQKYYLNEKGQRQSGFQEINGKKYFFSRIKDNVMRTGWVLIDGSYYYFDVNTGMVVGNANIDSNNINFSDDGKLVNGLVKINNNKYYFVGGVKQSGFQEINGRKYFFSRIKDNVMRTGWILIDGFYYYFNENGEMQKGLIEIDSQKYYLNEKGQRQSGFQEINGKKYFFSRINDNAMRFGWLRVNDFLYYADNYGVICDTAMYIDGLTYNFTNDGKVKLVGWNTINNQRYYFNTAYQIIGTKVKQVIDISVYQKNIDWETLNNSGQVYGVIVRIGYMGTGNVLKLDAQFLNNVKALKQYNIPYGLYFYSYAWNNADALAEANAIKDVINKYDLNPSLGIYWDQEEVGYVSKRSGVATNNIKTVYENITRTFISNMSNLMSKYIVGIYANLDYTKNYFNDYVNNHVKWIAQWGPKCDFNYGYKIWQYSSVGSVPGIEGNVDLDYYFD